MMENNLKKRVMFRIYIEFMKDFVIKRAEYFLFVLAFLSSLIFVSIIDVLHNMPKNDFVHTFNFLMAAVKETEWFIKAVVGYTAIWSSISVSKFTYRNIQKYKGFGFNKIRISV